MKKIIISLATVALCANIANAQSTSELYNFSNQSRIGATARVSAMAGAYTSLGADLSSMLINPAGLAMYQCSEVSITPSVIINQNNNNYSGINPTSQSNTKFVVSNLAGVFHSRGGLTFAAGYNRLADFTGKRESYGSPQQSSIGQIYADQLQGIPQVYIQSPRKDPYRPYFEQSPNIWRAMMAYQTGLVNPMSDKDEESNYTMGGLFNANDTQSPQSYVETTGAVNEFTLAMGYNYNDILYLGFSMGFQDIHYREDYSYSELYHSSNSGSLQDMTTRSYLGINGNGFNMRFGATVRPTDWLRIGVAYHTPTWMSLNESSYSDMTVYDKLYNTPAYADTPDLLNDYAFRTPSRLLAGASVSIAGAVIISADYERTWYNQMTMKTTMFNTGYRVGNTTTAIDNLPNLADNFVFRDYSVDLNSIIRDYYQSVNSYRLGVEAQPYPGLFIRAGYSYTSSPYRDVRSNVYMSNLSDYGDQTLYTCGLGYRSAAFGVDLTYSHSQVNSLPETYYSYIGSQGTIQPTGYNYNTNTLSQILLSFTFRIR